MIYDWRYYVFLTVIVVKTVFLWRIFRLVFYAGAIY